MPSIPFLIYCSVLFLLGTKERRREKLTVLQNQELLTHKPQSDISVRCPGSVSSGVNTAVTALHYSAALSVITLL